MTNRVVDSGIVCGGCFGSVLGPTPLDHFPVSEREAVNRIVHGDGLPALLERGIEANRAIDVVTSCREVTGFEARDVRRVRDSLEEERDVLLFRDLDVPWNQCRLAHDTEVPQILRDVLHDSRDIASAESRIDLLNDSNMVFRHGLL